jgi:hypothetical protein
VPKTKTVSLKPAKWNKDDYATFATATVEVKYLKNGWVRLRMMTGEGCYTEEDFSSLAECQGFIIGFMGFDPDNLI